MTVASTDQGTHKTLELPPDKKSNPPLDQFHLQQKLPFIVPYSSHDVTSHDFPHAPTSAVTPVTGHLLPLAASLAERGALDGVLRAVEVGPLPGLLFLRPGKAPVLGFFWGKSFGEDETRC